MKRRKKKLTWSFDRMHITAKLLLITLIFGLSWALWIMTWALWGMKVGIV